jgi:hypothetical protein
MVEAESVEDDEPPNVEIFILIVFTKIKNESISK